MRCTLEIKVFLIWGPDIKKGFRGSGSMLSKDRQAARRAVASGPVSVGSEASMPASLPGHFYSMTAAVFVQNLS